MKLALSAGALVLSMALAGCGGGGTSTNLSSSSDDGDGRVTEASCTAKGVGFNATTMQCTETCLRGYANYNDGMCTPRMATRTPEQNMESVRERAAIQGHSPSLIANFGGNESTTFRINGIEAERYAGDAEIGLGGDAGSSTTNPNPNFRKAPGAGSMGQAFTYTSTATDPVTERVVVYTNIEKAGEAAWTTDGLDPANTAIQVDAGVVTIPDTGIHARHIAGVVLPREVDSDTGTNSNPAPAALGPNGAGVKGSLFGVEGTFECAAACNTIVRNQDGRITVHNGDPTSPVAVGFTPTAAHATGADIAKIKAKYVTPDPTYAVFGYWAKTPSKAGEAVEIETFARFGGAITTTPQTASTVIGKATYNGAAVGRYSRIDGADTYSGDFTANATLTATFGTGGSGVQGATVADQGVTGTISGFRSAGDAALADLGWSLKLNKAKFTGSGSGGNLANLALDLTTLPTTDGGSGVSGQWSAVFAGNSQINNQPSDIVGQFNGSFRAGRGNVAGAFGASRQ